MRPSFLSPPLYRQLAYQVADLSPDGVQPPAHGFEYTGLLVFDYRSGSLIFHSTPHRWGAEGFENLLSFLFHHVKYLAPCIFNGQVENDGFEPSTPCLQSRCSSQLS